MENKEAVDKIDKNLDNSVEKRVKTWLDDHEHVDFSNEKSVNELIQQFKIMNDDDSNAEDNT